MSIEIIGMIATKDQSETRLPSGPEINRDYVRDLTQAHEASGFDRVLVAHSASQADATHVVAYAAAHTDRIGFLIAQRPGFVSPTYEARLLATLDQFTAGRGKSVV